VWGRSRILLAGGFFGAHFCHTHILRKFFHSSLLPFYRLVAPRRLPGCDCPPLFEGPHCEHLKTAAQINDDALQQPSDDNGKNAGRAFGIFVATIVALMGGFFVWRQVRRCRRAKSANRNQSFNGAAILNLQGFRDHASFRDEVVPPTGPPSPGRTGTGSITGHVVSSFSNDEAEEEQQERSFSSSSEEDEEQQDRSFAVGELLHDVTIN
jgi:hypothetical protein